MLHQIIVTVLFTKQKKMQKQMKIHPEFWKQYNTPGADPEKEDAGEARASSWRRPVRRIS